VPLKGADAVSVIDVEAREEVHRITGTGLSQPHGSALSPDGRFLFVTNNNQNGAYTPTGDDPKSGTVVIIDTDTREIVNVIETGQNPTGIGTFGGQTASSLPAAP